MWLVVVVVVGEGLPLIIKKRMHRQTPLENLPFSFLYGCFVPLIQEPPPLELSQAMMSSERDSFPRKPLPFFFLLSFCI